MNSPRFMKGLYVLLTLLGLLAIPVCSFAQGAWVSPKGTGYVGISYQDSYDKAHFFGNGETTNKAGVSLLGQIRFQSIFFDGSYSITDKLAISGSIPYVSGKFIDDSGITPGTGFGNAHVITVPGPDGKLVLLPNGKPDPAYQHVTVDDGHYHSGFQDVTLRLRYSVAANPLQITPFMQYNAPSHAYPFFSHSVYGNRVAEFQIGTYMARTLDPFLPNMYIQGGYSFGWLQRILGISKTRQHGELEVGYFITPSYRVFGVLVGYVTNGGLNLFADFKGPPYTTVDPMFYHHTQITRDNNLDFGMGFDYAMSARWDLYFSGLRTLDGRNMHATSYGLSFGAVWGFGGTPQRPCHC
jgi:hypothetical protein